MLSAIMPAFIEIRLIDVIDIFLVALLMYILYNLLKGTAAVNIFFGILSIFILWRVVSLLEMEMLSQVLGAFISVGIIALIIVFQPEIRQFLFLIGTPRFLNKVRKYLFFLKFTQDFVQLPDIDAIVSACRKLSLSRTGALIVIARLNELDTYADTGQIIDGKVSDELIESIFFKNNPLHDGALIIHENRIVAARVILPVSASRSLPAEFGLRHRAALGITERTDAIAIVVSEETGHISVFKGSEMKSSLSPAELKQILDEELIVKEN